MAEDELHRLCEFINDLNEEVDKGAVLVVEGKRDRDALVALGYQGDALIFNNFKGIHNLAESLENESKVILLLDMDRKGRYLTTRLMKIMNNIDLYYKRELIDITKGRIKCIE
ncbi:MAG: topoisomerase, partial [Candidatus Nitrosothermus koennekii]